MILKNTSSALIAAALLSTACGSKHSKHDQVTPVAAPMPTASVHKDPPVPAPAVPAETASTPAMPAIPATEVEPTAKPEVVITPAETAEPAAPLAPEVPAKLSLPAARPLTEAEKQQFLTNDTQFFDYKNDVSGYQVYLDRGDGFVPGNLLSAQQCMVPSPDFSLVNAAFLHDDAFMLLPLSSAAQMKDVLTYAGHPLYISKDIEHSQSNRLPLVAIAKKIMRTYEDRSMIFAPAVAAMSDDQFKENCGVAYQSGDISGHYFYSVIWIDLDEVNTKEAVISRLIDSKHIGSFSDAQMFAKHLHAFTQLLDGSGLKISGVKRAATQTSGSVAGFDFDFSDVVASWNDAIKKNSDSKPPMIGSLLNSYPDRS